VGCVLADAGGHVLGEGAHLYADRDHAEIAALKQAIALGNDVRGATAYVTLEPCAHHGRTGPCADALIAAGLGRVIVATIDPNPLVREQGIIRMRDAGIDVSIATGPLADQARRLNDAFAHFIQHGRPFVTLKAALSVDGRLAPPAAARSTVAPHWITGTAARADAQALRHAADAILTGIGTILADDPTLSDRSGLPRRRPLLRVVLDGQLRTPATSKLVTTAAADVLILCASGAPLDREAALRERGVAVERVATRDGHLDPAAVLAALSARAITSVLVEAGHAINGAFLRAGLVDKVVLYFAEAELGLDAVPFAAGLESPYALQQQLSAVKRASFASDIAPGAEDVRIAGYLHDPWAGLLGSS
jgi:diaminohydroxyphosphoribosylaminopyrimidine deaminase/5-amino-6-(5-phosphoribosylamino)uracil reductase